MAGNSTLLLDQVAWDLVVDAHGDIAVASAPYSLAQDAASAIRTVYGEVYYDTTVGVQYNLIFGQSPSVPVMKTLFQAAAETVPGVASAVVFITAINQRQVTGQVQVTPEGGGATTTAPFTVNNPQVQ